MVDDASSEPNSGGAQTTFRMGAPCACHCDGFVGVAGSGASQTWRVPVWEATARRPVALHAVCDAAGGNTSKLDGECAGVGAECGAMSLRSRQADTQRSETRQGWGSTTAMQYKGRGGQHQRRKDGGRIQQVWPMRSSRSLCLSVSVCVCSVRALLASRVSMFLLHRCWSTPSHTRTKNIRRERRFVHEVDER